MDHSILVGCLLFIPRILITEFNEGVSNIDDDREDYSGIRTHLVHITNEQLGDRDLIANTSCPVRSTMDLNYIKASSFYSNVNMSKKLF